MCKKTDDPKPCPDPKPYPAPDPDPFACFAEVIGDGLSCISYEVLKHKASAACRKTGGSPELYTTDDCVGGASIAKVLCCDDAKKAGKACAHKCCVEAAKAKKTCEKCNPKSDKKEEKK